MKTTIETHNDFAQLCCWPGTTLGDSPAEDFIQWIADDFGVRAKFAEIVITLPDADDTTGETGGRSDILFWIHSDDVEKFALQRMQFGMRWFEDVILNGGGTIYDDDVARRHPFNWEHNGVDDEVTEWEQRGGR